MLRGKKVKLNVSKAESPVLNMSIHNKFDIEIIDAKTGEVKQKARGYNIICDNLWQKLCNWEAYAKYIHYGSGSGTPSTSDTTLFNFIGYKSTSKVNSPEIDYINGVYTVQRKIELSESEEVGKTITEVGLAYGTGSNTLCTHAMLMDMNGNPISITKTETDILSIYSTVYVHFNSFGYSGGTIQLYKANSSGYNVLDALAGSNACRRDGSSSYGDTYAYVYNEGGLGVKDDSSSHRSQIKITHSGDYANKTMTLTMDRIPIAECNVGGIQCIDIGQYYYSYGTSYGPYKFGLCLRSGGDWFSYSSIVKEPVGTGDGSSIKFNLDFKYARDVKVYVDGSEVTNFSVKYGITDKNNFKYYMEPIRDGSSPDKLIYDYNAEDKFTKFIFYNPMYAIGISSITTSNGSFTLHGSNDLNDWHLISDARSIPVAQQNYKFWKIECSDGIYYSYLTFTPAADADSCIVFRNPPANGAVITADYKSDTIAKDENHVFDLSLTINLGEYVES